MFINKIDNFLNKILNNFNEYLLKLKFLTKISQDVNFVKYQNDILKIIKEFMNNINDKELNNIITNKKHINIIKNYIMRYCAYYIYFGISYHYKGDKDLYITNIIESSKNQNVSQISLTNFFNSDNNSKMISIFSDIKNIIKLNTYENIERVKIILGNEPIKYATTINIFNELGEDFINDYFLIKNNFHNIIKTLIIKFIYIQEDKKDIINLLEENDEEDGEYKYIEIVIGSDEKIIDFTILQQFLTPQEIRNNMAEDYYEFLENYRNDNKLNFLSTKKIINFLFSNKILIPITDDFLRVHKSNYKYGSDSRIRDDTKIKFIINIINKIKNYHSQTYKKNPKMKLAVKNLFYKQIKNRNIILYNDTEEINIISKLSNSQQNSGIDYLVDLKNIRNYNYLNYKDFSKDGFRLRTDKPIEGIRYSNLLTSIETRIGHNDLPLNVIGIIFNPSNKNVQDFNIMDLKDIHKINKNGYNSFINILKKKIFTNDDNLYYWLFNIETDIIKLDNYKNLSTLEPDRYIQNMLTEIYPIYLDLLYNNILNEINSNKSNQLNLFGIYHILRKYDNYLEYTQNMGINLSKDIIYKLLNHIYKEIKINSDDIDKKYLELQNKNIKIPISQLIKPYENILHIKEQEEEIDLDKIKNEAICYHYIKWDNLGRLSKKSKTSEELNQAVFNFVKQYVTQNNAGLYVCKSCSETLNLQKYVYEGTYVEELDTFLTTNLATTQKLENIPKYNKYTRTIRNIEKNIEKICSLVDLNYYLGNLPVIKLRRTTIIKDVIDIILIHTKYLKEQPKDRIVKGNEKYGINKELTNLFFFELNDKIFLTSSEDTDYYKLIKFNNVIAYIVLMIIIDMNSGMILTLKNNKKCNFFLYSNIGKNLFNNIYLILNETEKILISNIPLLGYVIFYFSCMLCNNKIWLSTNDANIFNIQKMFIHTIVDLMNSLILANLRKEKDYQYEIIVNRLLQRIKNVYNNKDILNKIDEENNKNIRFKDGKISFITKKIKYIDVSKIEKNYIHTNIISQCKSNNINIQFLKYKQKLNNVTIFTNCPDGQFHNWIYNKKINDIECSNCKYTFNNISKSKEENIDKIKILKLTYLKKLGEIYCISGEYHDKGPDGRCSKCKINLLNREYTNNQLYELEKNINKVIQNENIISLNNIKKYFVKKQKHKNDVNSIITHLTDRYNKNGTHIINNIDDFIDKLINIVGEKIKITNNVINLKNNMYLIYNDYIGNSLKESIILYENRVNINFNKNFNKNVISIKDNKNNVIMYYDNITKRYLGYQKYDKYYNINSNNNIEIIYSIRDNIINLGNNDNKRTYLLNLKQIITNINYFINKIKFKLKVNDNNHGNKIIKYFQSKINKINTINKNNKKGIFKHLNIIKNNFNDNKQLLFYLIFNLDRLLEYNNNTNIAVMIIRIIRYNYEQYYIPIDNLQIRKYEKILNNETPYINDTLKTFGIYQELIQSKEIDDEEVNNTKELMEELHNSYDMDGYTDDDIYDDYEPNDDIVNNMIE